MPCSAFLGETSVNERFHHSRKPSTDILGSHILGFLLGLWYETSKLHGPRRNIVLCAHSDCRAMQLLPDSGAERPGQAAHAPPEPVLAQGKARATPCMAPTLHIKHYIVLIRTLCI